VVTLLKLNTYNEWYPARLEAHKSISTLQQKGRLSKCALKGSKHAINFFRAALPHRYLACWFFNPKNFQEYFQKCS
jgi:hypothetical protein